jgi:hypothetical protein
MICSNMKLNFIDGKIDNFSAYVKPDATFTPPHEIKAEDERLKGFIWRDQERPVREDVVQGGKYAPKRPGFSNDAIEDKQDNSKKEPAKKIPGQKPIPQKGKSQRTP